MKTRTKYITSFMALCLSALVITCTDEEGNKVDDTGMKVYNELLSFEEETGTLQRINFEKLPPNGSSCDMGPISEEIPNPLIIENVTFAHDYCLETGACSSPTCQPDPDNPHGVNITLFLNTGGTIDFPAGTRGVMLVIEGIGDDPYTIQATDGSGSTTTATGRGVYYGIAYTGFTSPYGISQLEFLGGAGPPLVLSEVLFELSP